MQFGERLAIRLWFRSIFEGQSLASDAPTERRDTQTFNRRHKRVGHLFQGRFKAILVQKEAHLLELCRYVVLNPLRVNAKTRVREWGWSSYSATAGLEAARDFLTVDWILSQFGQKRGQAQMKYREFETDGLNDRLWQKLKGQIFLGTEQFISRHTSRKKDVIREVPRAQRRPARPTLEQILEKKTGGRSVDIAYREYGYRMNEIARHLGVHYATVSRRLKALESKPQ